MIYAMVHQPGSNNAQSPFRVIGVRASVGRVPANGPRFPPFDPAREAGTRTDSALSRLGDHRHLPIATRPRVAAR
jgi:hypothetical protein